MAIARPTNLSEQRGFTLIEALVAIVVGVIVVVAVGGLSQTLTHHRVTSDSNSAAVSLAERQMEKLLSEPNLNPPATPDCTASPRANLCGDTSSTGLHHVLSSNVDAHGNPGGPYIVEWWVIDSSAASSSPLITPAGFPRAKQIKVTVTHSNNPQVDATIITILRP